MKELLTILGLAAVLILIVLISAGILGQKKNSISGDEKTIATKTSKSQLDDPDEVRKKYGIPSNDSYILPAEFKIGLIKQNKPIFMNNCNPNVLYPINGLGPDYGWKMPKDCRCTEFVQAP